MKYALAAAGEVQNGLGPCASTQSNALSSAMVLACGVPILVVFVGCGRKDRVEVSPVRGRVVYSGSGVSKATVIFHPVDATDDRVKRMRPFAYADSNGEFAIKTYVTGDGAAPGKYRVSIIAPAGPTPTGDKDRPPDDSSAGQAQRAIPPAVVQKYANVDTAGIEVQILEGENNLEPFELQM